MVYLNCAVIGLGGRGVIKTRTDMAARVRLNMLTSDLTSLVPPQFSHWLQGRKVGTKGIFFKIIYKEISPCQYTVYVIGIHLNEPLRKSTYWILPYTT